MSEKRARYVGHPDGATIEIPIGTEGNTVIRHVPHGGEVPTEIDGQKVPAGYRDSLLEQKENWTEVKRATGDEATGTPKTAAAGKDGE